VEPPQDSFLHTPARLSRAGVWRKEKGDHMAKAGLLFVGTGDGVVLFSDPGGTGRWLRIGQELRGQAVHALWLAADTPLVVLAAAGAAGLMRSDDGGQSWRRVLDAHVLAIAGGDRHSASRMYSCTAGGLVLRSDDAGETWVECARGSWPTTGDARLIVAQANAQALYLSAGDGGVWASRNGGSGWVRFGSQLPEAATALVEDLAAPGSLYVVAAGELFHCTGEMAEWRRVDAAPPENRALTMLAGKQPVLLLAREHELQRSDDAGSAWAAVGNDVAWEGAITALTTVPHHIDTALAGSAGGQLAESSDRGRTWHILKSGLGPIQSIASARLI